MARGIVEIIFSLSFLFKRITGAKNKEAKKNLNKVSEIESITPESLEEAIKEPATKKVANNTNKGALNI